MKIQRLVIFSLAALVSVVTYGQLTRPLGLGIVKSDINGAGLFQPQMHVEGDILYVCTHQGLYSKDLSSDESTWQLVGFKGIPLQNYVRKGDDILALRYNINSSFLLLLLDGGNTYEDVTPETFRGNSNKWSHEMISIAQKPDEPNSLLISSFPEGIFRSTDFGQTWDLLLNTVSKYVGYHPLNPEVIYESYGEDSHPILRISHDAGQTWQDHSLHDHEIYNAVYRMAFHPTDPDRWIVGGGGCVYTSTDNGYTWNTQVFPASDDRCLTPWYYALYDNENSEIVYLLGFVSGKTNVIYSMDGGNSWSSQIELINKTTTELVYDLKQYENKLLVFTESDVYEISKSELLAQTTTIRSISTTTTEKPSKTYDLCGRRVQGTPKKGVYIQNGKKVVIK
ncbi:MAG: hypothetical protein J6T43_02285 [Prevotella sp.]|nr:hypothetical protein [Prevotella sp.]